MIEEKKNNKVSAIYHAVFDLLSEGEDIEKIKVADITNRAGIGKGTAYDYFDSKEELIVKALLYYFQSTINRLITDMNQKITYREKFYYILEQIEKQKKDRTCIVKCSDLVFKKEKLRQSFINYGICDPDSLKNPIRIIRYLIQEGKNEGVICESLPDTYLEYVFASKFISYLMYIEKQNEHYDCSSESMKKLLYQGLLNELKQ